MTEPSSPSLVGQVAIVTGASRGIGRAITIGLAAAGAAVVGIARTASGLEETIAAATAAGGTGLGLTADVTSPDQIEAVVAETTRRFGPVDLLVNNAAEATALGATWEVDPDAWWHTFDVNLRGPFLGARAVLPTMIERRSGRIVNLISLAGWAPGSGYNSAYAASKAALIRFSESLAEEAAPHGISVFALSPGIVDTEGNRTVRRARDARLGTPGSSEGRAYLPPELTADTIVFLAGGGGDGLSGHCLDVSDDLANLATRADEIHDLDLYQMRRRIES